MSKHKQWLRYLYLAAVVVLAWLGLWFLGPVLLPFVLGLLPASAADKAIVRLQGRLRVPRWLAASICVSMIYLLLFLSLWFLWQLLFREVTEFLEELPSTAASFSQPVSRLQTHLLRFAARFPDGVGEALENWILEFFDSGAGLGQTLYNGVFSVVSSIVRKAPDIAMFLLTSLLSGFMLAAELPRLKQFWRRKAPKLWQEKSRLIAEKLKGTLLSWLKAQGKLVIITFLVLTAGFLVLGVDYPLLLAVLIALLDALPVLGTGTILIPWSILRFLSGSTFQGVGLLCIYGVASLLRTALEPRLLGKQMGLDPLLTLFVLYAGYHFFGIIGMIFFPMGLMLMKQVAKPN